MAKKKIRSAAKKKSVKGETPRPADAVSTVYKDFSIWESTRAPQWHPVKKMRYVFFRMIGGITVTDAIAEIRWNASEFWHLVDKNRAGPFGLEYKRAKKLQGRAFADSVITIAEGRDKISRGTARELRKLIVKTLKRIGGSKKMTFAMKQELISRTMDSLTKQRSDLIARNKLQIDGAKWIAKTSNPNEYSESSRMSLGGTPASDDDSQDAQPAFIIQFVGPDGKVAPV